MQRFGLSVVLHEHCILWQTSNRPIVHVDVVGGEMDHLIHVGILSNLHVAKWATMLYEYPHSDTMREIAQRAHFILLQVGLEIGIS